MQKRITRICIAIFPLVFTLSCSGLSDDDQFAEYQREFIGSAPIGNSVTKAITFQNPSQDDVQHITGMNFDAGQNTAGNFRIDKVEVGGVAQNPKNKDITIPAGSILQIYVTYQPLNLETTKADLGGWVTGEEEVYVPQKPKDEETKDEGPAEEKGALKVMSALIGKAESEPEIEGEDKEGGEDEGDNNEIVIDESELGKDEAIHRALIAVIYDRPGQGLIQLEVVGVAGPGPNGETSAGGTSTECPAEGGILCYRGGFAIELPELMTTGPKQLNMPAPVVFRSSGSSVELDMAKFPAVLLVLKGNGPGEPLEGKPINAVSIVISGTEGVKAAGTFDGSKIEVNGVSFRIRVILGEIKEADINPGLQAAVDFNVKDITMTTIKPYTNGSITLSVKATLSKTPSGNAMFDQFLGGANVNVTMDGSLAIQ